MNRNLSVVGNLATGVLAFLLYLGATTYFTATSLRDAVVGGVVVGLLVFVIAFSLTRMIGSYGDRDG